jgi:histidinol dehydrogenase
MIAGPSEIMIIADDKANPKFVAYDLLSQAEHDENARAILVCKSIETANKINKELEIAIEKISRREIALKSIKQNGICFVTSLFEDESIMITNFIAPEHLEIMTDNPELISKRINNAGAIFLGSFTPEALGDYIAGPSHVLPTYGTARFSSGLGVYDFIKRTSMIKATEEGFKKLAKDIIKIANEEKLDAHALSAKVRLD